MKQNKKRHVYSQRYQQNWKIICKENGNNMECTIIQEECC